MELDDPEGLRATFAYSEGKLKSEAKGSRLSERTTTRIRRHKNMYQNGYRSPFDSLPIDFQRSLIQWLQIRN